MLPPDGGPEFNRLIHESSPYLLQHARNPVDWYPWGTAAFEKARREGKPIFLSIGYSTCHWCHVMERESFEVEAVAALMNEHFVSIKVDREERPDVDQVYMTATQAMTGSGGWPMSVFLNHDLEPFFAGTYFPPEDRYGRPGFRTVLTKLAELWKNDRESIDASAEQATAFIRGQVSNTGGEAAALDKSVLEQATRAAVSRYDTQRGGFGGAPKFPMAHNLSFLLRSYDRSGDAELLRKIEHTLEAMAAGGIHDQVGGGFHRYSTDREWLLPHFEKMLYDQALLARAYLEAFQVTGQQAYADTARDIFRYVLRDMTDPAGGFYSAEDADSEGEEGKFYVWTRAEVTAVLGEESGALFCEVYGVKDGGNFRDEAAGTAQGTNILHLPKPMAEVAAAHELAPDELAARMAEARARLFEVRERRVHPHKDDKVLTDWNGLMISALALGAQALDDPEYAQAAERAADFLLSTMRNDDGRLLHRWREGQAGIQAHLEDYAFLVFGLVDLYETTFDTRWLEAARSLARTMVEFFWDEEAGGFFMTASDAEQLIVRAKELYDGAIPSGNSVAAHALVRLGRLLMDKELEGKGRATLSAWSAEIRARPAPYPWSLMALDMDLGPSREIVVAGSLGDPVTAALLREVHARFLPRKVLVLHPPGEAGAAIRGLAPYLAEQGLVDGKPAAYVCEDYACQLPVTTAEALVKQLSPR